jgi:GNAT superfamily N-acetyltransferase
MPMAIRPLTEQDIPGVTDLYWTYLRRRQGAAPARLQSVFRELCFGSPFRDDAIRAQVFETQDGQVRGFIGAIVRRMSACGRPIRLMLGGNLVVHPDFRAGRIAQHLVEAVFAQDADLAIVDSANEIARRILSQNGFRVVPTLNMHWRRVLRPAHYGVYGVSLSAGYLMSTGLKLASKPACWLADGIAARLSRKVFRLRHSYLHGSDLNAETLLQCLVEFRKGYSLWTEYDLPSLQWLLEFMAHRTARGVLRKILLRDDDGKIVGWYIYYAKPGAVGEVVQVGGDPEMTKDVLDHLFYDAWEQGVAGVHGLIEMRRMADFSDKHCFFTCRGGWTMVRSRHPELLQLLDADTLFTRLDGEWCLDIGD